MSYFGPNATHDAYASPLNNHSNKTAYIRLEFENARLKEVMKLEVQLQSSK